MVFSSLTFLFLFLPAVLLLYFLIPERFAGIRWRNGVLLAASLLFYAWGEPVYLLVMLFSVAMNYGFGLLAARAKGKKGAKAALSIAVAANLLLLGVFKYTGFAVENLRNATGWDLQIKEIALPIGVSFFTFQAMSYVIDVYRGKAGAQKNPLRFALYVSLFPQLIAGPIVRYSTVAEELGARRTDFADAAAGAKRFCVGLAKKVLLANSAGALWTELTGGGTAIPAASAWIAAVAFSFQIYFDFSGYSDMAIGLGRIFGFHFEENFLYPYSSRSITEFWNRWHISLSTWFREYVYIPLGGNRRGKAKQIRNILIVWMLTGLWHGASWNFVFWGLYYGVLLLLEKFVLKKALERLPRALQRVYTLLAVLFGWVLFALESSDSLFSFLGSMFGANGAAGPGLLFTLRSNAVLFAVLTAASLPLGKRLAEKLRKRLGERRFAVPEFLWYAALFFLSVSFLVDGSYNPFIYFRF